MYCTQCGQEVADKASFCSHCGVATRLGEQKRQGSEFAPRRLFRLTHDKKIAGICAGLARYANVDVTLMRLLVIAVSCFTGFVPGVIAYILGWIIMPVDTEVQRPLEMVEPLQAK